MTISENMVVTLQYTLSDHTTGDHIESTNNSNPLVFLYGTGGMIPAFEDNLRGLKSGDSFEFSIPAANAYGIREEERIVDIPLSVFFDEQGNFDNAYFKLGAVIPMSDGQGNQLRGTIRAIDTENINMDFNHPLADIDLHFSGEIKEIRLATKDEIDHGHVHGPGGHHH
jgi:FKBP-type peptidyl-prolyl cis-trans isomerase SlyD